MEIGQQLPYTGHRMPNSGNRILDTGSRRPDTGNWTPDTGHWIPETTSPYGVSKLWPNIYRPQAPRIPPPGQIDIRAFKPYCEIISRPTTKIIAEHSELATKAGGDRA
jgi:hypothetical protein